MLYVFDSSQPALDVQQLTATLTTEIKNLLGSLTQPISVRAGCGAGRGGRGGLPWGHLGGLAGCSVTKQGSTARPIPW